MRHWLVVGLLAACGPSDRVEPAPDAIALPAGVWEPAPGADRGPAAVTVGADGTLWWAFTEQKQIEDLNVHRTESHVWLTQTTPTGDVLMTPELVDAAERGEPLIAMTDRGPVVATESYFGKSNDVHLFDRNGVARGTHPIFVDDPLTEPVHARTLVAAPDGSLRMIVAIESTTAEVVGFDVDPNGAVTASTRLGTPDDGWPQTVTANVRPDNSLVVAWDRTYDQCQGPRPAQTLTTSMTMPPGPIFTVGDLPERGEWSPRMASAGDTLYVAWVTDMYSASAGISLARYPDVGSALTTIGDGASMWSTPQLAVAAPDRGAVAWEAGEQASLEVVSFQNIGGAVVVGAPHVIPHVVGVSVQLVGMVHVGDEHYVVAWLEYNGPRARLFATQLDLSQDARQRSAPHVPAPTDTHASPSPRRAFGLVPCSH